MTCAGGSAGNNADHSASNSQSLRVDIKPQLLEALPDKIRVSGMACGLGHALFLASGTGRVLSWGNGGNGRLGLDDLHDRSEACPVIGELNMLANINDFLPLPYLFTLCLLQRSHTNKLFWFNAVPPTALR